MNCRRINSLISAYIDGELNGSDMLAVRQHIGDCKVCRDEYESLRETKQILSGLQPVPPREDFLASIYAGLDAVETPIYRRYLSAVTTGLRTKLSPAFATVAVFCVAFLLLGARGRTPQNYDVARALQPWPHQVTVQLTDLGKDAFTKTDSQFIRFDDVNAPSQRSDVSFTFAGFNK